MRPLTPLPVLALAVVLTGCGPAAGPAPAADDLSSGSAAQVDPDAAPARLGQVSERVRAARTVRYSAVAESGRDGQPHEVGARVAGELDLPADAGTADVDLVALADLAQLAEAEAATHGAPDAQEAAPALDALARVRLSWTADELTMHAGGQAETAPRDGSESALLARVPEEPAGLLDVVSTATAVTVVGEEQVDGVATTHLRGSVEPRSAVDQGLGTSGQLSIAELPSLPVEVWLDAEGLPRRVRYTVTLPSLAGGTRTSVTTYEYRGWGEPVDLTG